MDRLSADNDLKELSDHFFDSTKTYLSQKYLKQGDAYAIRYNGEVIASFVIITKLPFRFQALLPNECKLKSCVMRKAVEVNAFSVTKKRHLRAVLALLFELLQTYNYRKLLIFYSVENKSVANLWRNLLKPHVVYRGKPNIEECFTSLAEVEFGLVNRNGVGACLNYLKLRNKPPCDNDASNKN